MTCLAHTHNPHELLELCPSTAGLFPPPSLSLSALILMQILTLAFPLPAAVSTISLVRLPWRRTILRGSLFNQFLIQPRRTPYPIKFTSHSSLLPQLPCLLPDPAAFRWILPLLLHQRLVRAAQNRCRCPAQSVECLVVPVAPVLE